MKGTVAVDRRLATQLAVRVGGEGNVYLNITDVTAQVPIAWNPFAPVDSVVGVTLSNEGNLRARGSYTLRISGPFGLGAVTQTYSAEEMLPGSTLSIEQQIPGLWPLVWQQAEASLTAEGVDSIPAGTSSVSTTFWSLPAGWIIILLLIICAGIAIGVRRARRWEDEDDHGEANNPT